MYVEVLLLLAEGLWLELGFGKCGAGSLDSLGPRPLPLPIRSNVPRLLPVLPLGLGLGRCQALGDLKASPLGVPQAGRGQRHHFNPPT